MLLKNFKLTKIDFENLEQKKFLDTMFIDKDDQANIFLGQMNNLEAGYLISNKEHQMIGYFNCSNIVINQLGKSSISIYYGISLNNRQRGYATQFLKEVSDFLLEQVDTLVLVIAKNNRISIKTALNNDYELAFSSPDEDDAVYIKEKATKKVKKR